MRLSVFELNLLPSIDLINLLFNTNKSPDILKIEVQKILNIVINQQEVYRYDHLI